MVEKVRSFLASHPDESYTASSIRNMAAGHRPSIARVLAQLADEGLRGGHDRGHHQRPAVPGRARRHIAQDGMTIASTSSA